MTKLDPCGVKLDTTDRHCVLHPNTSISELVDLGPEFVVSGSGSRVTTGDGRSYIDAAAGLWCVNVGYGRKEIAQAAFDGMSNIGYSHTFARFANEPQTLLAQRLLVLLEKHAKAAQMSKIFFGCTGSDANETQIKLARYFHSVRKKPTKRKIIARSGAYHGTTMFTAGLAGIPGYHQNFGLSIDEIVRVGCPHAYRHAEAGESSRAFASRLAVELEEAILKEGADNIAAFIAEPIMGAGGILIPPETYFDQVQSVLDKYDILLLLDEVITGFGRLGSWFASAKYNLQPDLISFAKGLTSGYFPLSAVAISEKVYAVLKDASDTAGPIAHGFTYSGHPVGAMTALAVLDVMENERLVENAAAVGAHLKQLLTNGLKDHPYVGDIRGEGLLLGVEFVRDRATKSDFSATEAIHRKIAANCRQKGLMIRPLSWLPVVSFSPPLCLSSNEAEEIAGIFIESTNEIMTSTA